MSSTRFENPFRSVGCVECRDPAALGFAFTMAFQPIVDLRTRRLFAYEALVRGTDGASAASVLALVNDHNRYRFDQACRIRAIELASRLGLQHIAGIIQVAVRLNIEVIAEGIESVDEREVLIALGVRYMQGYLFAHPGFEALVEPVFP